ncbi:MAG: BolA family protein [Candidatus Rariloculaceae bacterium]
MTQNRVNRITAHLEAEFRPQELEITDESHLHIGHAGAKAGKGHFRVRIVSEFFIDKRPIDRHRMVFRALEDMMKTDIHALSVIASAPDRPSAPNNDL